MAGLSKKRLLSHILQAVHESGWSAHFPAGVSHPFRIVFARENVSPIDTLIYIWTITHGGKTRPRHEYRIQITGADILHQQAGVKTLVLGYWPANDVFAGWDPTYHRTMLGQSPSFQIHEQSLLDAHTNKMGLWRKDNGEIAVAVSPSYLTTYMQYSDELHQIQSTDELEVFRQIVQDTSQARDESIDTLPTARQRTARMIAVTQRASDFRQRVLSAYHSTCAVCGLQLDLVDAAHLIPVRDPSSTDQTSNGICLCSLHHRAFDVGLIAILPSYRVMVNRTRISELRALERNGCEQMFRKNLRPQMILPVEPILRPTSATITRAMKARNIHASQVEPPM